jgi:hypothetical protein
MCRKRPVNIRMAWPEDAIAVLGLYKCRPDVAIPGWTALAVLTRQARVKTGPGSAHGFIFCHHAEFATDVGAFRSDDL